MTPLPSLRRQIRSRFGLDLPGRLLLRLARAKGDDLQGLAERLAVGETWFFRESEPLEALLAHLPPFPLIWCPGCSTGEEAYTIALVARDILGPGRVRVLGTDLNRAAIAHGAKGIYSHGSFRGEDVTFLHHNLMDRPSWSLIPTPDAIVCRNVLIHLHQGARQAIALDFHRKLAPEGILLLGLSETLRAPRPPFLRLDLGPGLLAYRKGPEGKA